MSAAGETEAGPWRRVILTYAPIHARAGLAALLALDDTLGAILRSTRDPLVGQMRLTWWYDALTALDVRPAPAEPVLRALQQEVLPRVTGTELAQMVEGWEELLDSEPLDDARLLRFADGRGARLFAAAGQVLSAWEGDPLAMAGRGWALADLAAHASDEPTRTRAAALAKEALAGATAVRWSRSARAIGAMTHWARMGPGAGPARMPRALWHRLTGR